MVGGAGGYVQQLPTWSREAVTNRPFPGQQGREKRNALRLELFERQGGLCHLCGKPMSLKRTGTGTKNFATFDHEVPHSEGGRAHHSNLKLAHGLCNSARGNAPLRQPPRIPGAEKQ